MRSMKKTVLFTKIFVVTLSLGLMWGCQSTAVGPSTASQKENLLVRSGFKAKTVTTPKQQQRVNALPAGKVSTVTLGGKLYYVALMFDAALGRFGFRAEAKDANSWNDRIWRETNHNLDRIITRDGVVYGVEIKNTQNYISREELRLKIRLCQYLNLIPL